MRGRPWISLIAGVLAAAVMGALAARIVGAADTKGGAGGSFSTSSAGFGRASSGSGSSTGANGSTSGSSGGAMLSSGTGKITVHVVGRVRKPGVYELRDRARVLEAVRRAGGMTSGADRQRLNLAAPLQDGQQVVVAAKTAQGTGGSASSAASGDAATSPPVDLNTATLEQLQTLDGVGPATAQKIIDFREKSGGLAGVDSLDEVPGFGPKTIESLRQQLGG